MQLSGARSRPLRLSLYSGRGASVRRRFFGSRVPPCRCTHASRQVSSASSRGNLLLREAMGTEDGYPTGPERAMYVVSELKSSAGLFAAFAFGALSLPGSLTISEFRITSSSSSLSTSRPTPDSDLLQAFVVLDVLTLVLMLICVVVSQLLMYRLSDGSYGSNVYGTDEKQDPRDSALGRLATQYCIEFGTARFAFDLGVITILLATLVRTWAVFGSTIALPVTGVIGISAIIVGVFYARVGNIFEIGFRRVDEAIDDDWTVAGAAAVSVAGAGLLFGSVGLTLRPELMKESFEVTTERAFQRVVVAMEKAAAEKQAAEKVAAGFKAAAENAAERAVAEMAAAREASLEKASAEVVALEKAAAEDKATREATAAKAVTSEAAARRDAAAEMAAQKAKEAEAAAEEAAAERSASARAASEKAEADKVAAEKVSVADEAARKAAQARSVADSAASKKMAAEKLAAAEVVTDGSRFADMASKLVGSGAAARSAPERSLAAERAARRASEAEAAALAAEEAKAVAARVAVEKAAARRVAARKAAKADEAARKAAAERAAAEGAVAEEQLAVERAARGEAEAEAAVQAAAADRIAAARAAAEKAALEDVAVQRAAAAEAAAKTAASAAERAMRAAAEAAEAEKSAGGLSAEAQRWRLRG
ncbi:unnamed protein product [Prorocentrum cordatum]|uniref:H(+)-exporting diphosphatase n=1 Tax=Prorocentrum cordatum TaxID=2364126 RepID=A0ABN9UZ87_9DINO|nr:unnamed protein product [Polarella glacialis]